MKIKDLVKNAILIAVYIVAVNINPIGFMAIQFRVAEALSVIPFFNRKFAPALIIGGALANLYSPLGMIDMVVGGMCAVIAYTFSKFTLNNYINSFIFSLASGILVSTELYYTAGTPYFLTILTVGFPTLIITSLSVYIISNTKLKKIIEQA
ncbi:QueT transporter family protein [Peptoniphilus raoultii]|uniref:QueT transporter family protein n=1 Tax=Peptoniphilus raoultii TaxID=1776387 RepID=UPI0008D97E6E|nr:QueT transporter family protein [Peptoniphilus raoultii]